jgi:hypothetical protein
MKFVCTKCEKLVAAEDAVLESVQTGFGVPQGFDVFHEECWNKVVEEYRKKREEE